MRLERQGTAGKAMLSEGFKQRAEISVDLGESLYVMEDKSNKHSFLTL